MVAVREEGVSETTPDGLWVALKTRDLAEVGSRISLRIMHIFFWPQMARLETSGLATREGKREGVHSGVSGQEIRYLAVVDWRSD